MKSQTADESKFRPYLIPVYGEKCAPLYHHFYFRNIHPTLTMRVFASEYRNGSFYKDVPPFDLLPNPTDAETPNGRDKFMGCPKEFIDSPLSDWRADFTRTHFVGAKIYDSELDTIMFLPESQVFPRATQVDKEMIDKEFDEEDNSFDKSVSGSTGDDVIGRLVKLLGGNRRHSTTAEMAGNLYEFRKIYVVGHGNSGYFETGCGPSGYSDEASVHYHNKYAWIHHIERIRWEENGEMWIWGCYVASGSAGIRLMQALANASGRRVSAYKGLITVGSSIVLSEGYDGWIDVHPGKSDEESLNFETPNQINMDNAMIRSKKLSELGFSSGYDEEKVRSMEILRKFNQQKANKSLSKEEADGLYKRLFYGNPFRVDGDFIGQETASVTIEFESNAPLHLQIICDSIAKDSASDACFYLAPDFSDYVDFLMK